MCGTNRNNSCLLQQKELTLKSVHFIESVRRLFQFSKNEEAREEGHIMFLPLPPAGNMSDTGPLQRTSRT